MDKAKFWGFAKSDTGIVIPNAEVEVFIGDSVSKSTLYADREGNVPLTNPFTAEDNGFFEFYVEGGRHRVEMDAEGAKFVLHNVLVGTAQGLDVEDLVDPGDLHPVATSGDHSDLNDIGVNTHTQIDSHIASTSNPHDVTKAQVGLGDVPNIDTTDAVNKAHDQNTDTALAEGTGNEVTASDARSHIDNADIHREINDSGDGATDLWSADKIITELDNVDVGTIATGPTIDGDGSASDPVDVADGAISAEKLSSGVQARIESGFGSIIMTEETDPALSGTVEINPFDDPTVETISENTAISDGEITVQRNGGFIVSVCLFIEGAEISNGRVTVRVISGDDIVSIPFILNSDNQHAPVTINASARLFDGDRVSILVQGTSASSVKIREGSHFNVSKILGLNP